MKILVTGFVVFVIWCFVSAWLYNDKLLPAMHKPAPVQTNPPVIDHSADSLAAIYASMPKTLMVYFDFDKSKLKTDPQISNRIAEFKAWLEKYPASMLSVTGHTDLVGTDDYNQKLGLKRAEVVEKFLETQGVDAGRMITESKGESQPVAGYITSEGRALNRRTEISIKMK
jgi:OOP family OmpA-OmpF porin